ncbi:hypothetical protein BDQ17DRAFT_1435015 [Cyathus striatus]|nr:hypothetical protein BDQ17DRAFT_1435015 [Cyathus striatus]
MSALNSSYPTFTGQTVLLTGATSGIGYAAALRFLEQDVGTLVITARTQSKGEEAKARLVQESGVDTKKVVVYKLNLELTTSVVSFVEELGRDYAKALDAVVLNAGMFSFAFEVVDSGNEKNLQMLAKAPLIPLLPLSGSILEYLNDPNAPNRTSSGRYADTKLLVMLLFRHISTLVNAERVVINALCPGAVKGTNLARRVPYLLKPFVTLYQMVAMSQRDVGEASWEVPFAVSDKAGKETHGELLVMSQAKELPTFVDTEVGKKMVSKLWKETADWCQEIAPGCVRAVDVV